MSRSVHLFFLIVTVIVTSAADLCAQFSFHPTHYSVDNGLTQNTVNCIYQDRHGFMWFGTNDGLSHFNGYEFKTYESLPFDSTSLANNTVYDICADGKSRMWVATSRDLCLYNEHSDNFTSFSKMNSGLTSPHIVDLEPDKKGNIWIATSYGLCKYDLKSDRIIPYVLNTDDRVYSNVIVSIAIDDEGKIWCGTRQIGINIFDPATETFNRIRRSDEAPVSLHSDSITRVINDRKGHMWVSYLDKGLSRIDLEENKIVHYHKENKKIPDNHILKAYVDRSEKLIFGTMSFGLVTYNPASDSFTLHDKNNARLFNNKITAMAFDKQGNAWVGYHYGGIDYFAPHKNIYTESYNKDKPGLLEHNFVADIVYGRDGTLWIANDEMGVVGIRDHKKVHHFDFELPGFKYGQDAAISLLEDSKGNLYIGRYQGGLTFYDVKKHSFKTYVHNPNNKYSIAGNDVRDIKEDGQGRIWAAVHGKGITCFTPENGTFRNYSFSVVNMDISHSNWTFTICLDGKGQVWTGSTEGLFVMNMEDGQYDTYRHHQYDTTSLTGDFVYSTYEDSKQRMWIGTSKGLNLFIPETKSFKHVTRKNGLPDNRIFSIVEDHAQFIWVSTSKGITRIDPESFEMMHLKASDGLQGYEFNMGAGDISPDGELFWGGNNGFSRFYPDSIRLNTIVPDVLLTGLSINNVLVQPGANGSPLEKMLNETKVLTLSHKQNMLGFEFIALNYVQPQQNRYAYMLEGVDEQFIYCGNIRKVTYSNLKHGTYTFKVIASNNDSVWNTAGHSIEIRIRPPFWLSIWAYIFYVIAIVALLYFFRKYTIIGTNRKNQLIIDHLEQETIKEIHQAKLRFFTEVSHEIRTPLTLIIDPLNRLVASWKGEEAIRQQIQMIQRNSNKMLNLINQLLDFRKVETGHDKVSVYKDNLAGFVRESGQSFMDTAKQQNIQLILPDEHVYIQSWFDHEKLEKILFNLLSNAFKFTPAEGTIEVSVKETDKHIAIEVSDSGTGIPEDKLSEVFGEYKQVQPDASRMTPGTGIGLALTKKLVELHHGTIEVQSSKNEGTRFLIYLPVGNHLFKEDEIVENPVIEGVEETPVIGGIKRPANKESKQLVLLVEDRIDLLRYLTDILMEDFDVITAQAGQPGLEMAINNVPDVIVSDVMMPGMDGNEMTARLKSDPMTSHIPVILLTARNQLAQEKESLRHGADVYLTKPIDTEILKLKIANILQTQSRHQKLIRKQILENPDLAIVDIDPGQELVIKVKKIIEENLDNPDLSIEFLSNTLGLSRTQIFRKFKGIIDQTPKAFIQTVRLKHAKAMIEQTQKYVSEIAYEVGFSDPKYFSRCFKEEFGMSPTECKEKKK